MQTQLLQNYIYLFQNLHVNKQKGKCAPHKAVMDKQLFELIHHPPIRTELTRLLLSTYIETR